MSGHKCDGCRYKGEHVEMGFKPFGVCYKETNLIEAEKNYNAETCPYKYALPQLYKTEPEPEAEPVQWPKENPHLKPAVKISVDFEALNKSIASVVAAFDKLVEDIKKYSWYAARIAANIGNYPNKRVIHLAKHGKPRTRKKNINRIAKDFKRIGRNPALFAQE